MLRPFNIGLMSSSRLTSAAALAMACVCAASTIRTDPPKEEPSSRPKISRTVGEDVGSIGCRLQDTAGNIWFSTAGSGVFRFDGRSFVNFSE